MATINNHFFHDLYSDGYGRAKPPGLLWTNPIHIVGANFGYYDEDSRKFVEFKNEQDAFRWYKKRTINNPENFEKLAFPSDFCKNYFLIAAKDFSKFRNYFHGMVKSVNVEYSVEIEEEGNMQKLNDCGCPQPPPASSSSSSPIIELGCCHKEDHPNFGAIGCYLEESPANSLISVTLEPFSKIEGPDLSEINNVLNIDTFNLQINSEDENCCYCPPCDLEGEEKDNYNCGPYTWKSNISLNFKCDTKEIFTIGELENRFGATNLHRSFSPSFDDSSRTQDGLLYMESSLFKDNWVLDENRFNFFKFMVNEKLFPNNSTRINDPIIINSAYYTFTPFEANFQSSCGIRPPAIIFPPKPIREKLDSQIDNEERTENFGEISVKIKNENYLTNGLNSRFEIFPSNFCYIKSEKKFMCFIEVQWSTNDFGTAYFNQFKNDPDDLKQIPLTARASNSLQLITTTDNIYQDIEDECRKDFLKLKKDSITIKIDDLSVDIEVFMPLNVDTSIVQTKDEIIIDNCDPIPLEFNCDSLEIKKKWSFQKPVIEFESWKNSFSNDNVFPKKVVGL